MYTYVVHTCIVQISYHLCNKGNIKYFMFNGKYITFPRDTMYIRFLYLHILLRIYTHFMIENCVLSLYVTLTIYDVLNFDIV